MGTSRYAKPHPYVVHRRDPALVAQDHDLEENIRQMRYHAEALVQPGSKQHYHLKMLNLHADSIERKLGLVA